MKKKKGICEAETEKLPEIQEFLCDFKGLDELDEEQNFEDLNLDTDLEKLDYHLTNNNLEENTTCKFHIKKEELTKKYQELIDKNIEKNTRIY